MLSAIREEIVFIADLAKSIEVEGLTSVAFDCFVLSTICNIVRGEVTPFFKVSNEHIINALFHAKRRALRSNRKDYRIWDVISNVVCLHLEIENPETK